MFGAFLDVVGEGEEEGDGDAVGEHEDGGSGESQGVSIFAGGDEGSNGEKDVAHVHDG